MNYFKNNKLIFLYFIYIILATVLFLFAHIDQFPNKYVYTDWLINYEGGFIRRGLLGQITYLLSNILNFKITSVILFFQVFAYLLYYFIFIYLFNNIKINFFWVIFIFASISFLYPLGELEALGRKDIFVLLFFLLFTITNRLSLNNYLILFFIFFGISVLIHEISFFYLHYYLLIIYLKNKIQFKKTIPIFHYFLIIIFLIILIYISLFLSKSAQLEEIITSYHSQNIFLNIKQGAFSWLSRPFEVHFFTILNKISLIGFLRYFYILIIYLIPIFYFIKIKKNPYKIDTNKLVLYMMLISIPTYFVANDWGRITYLSYNFLIITIIFIFNNKLIDINYMNLKLKKIPITMKVIIFFIVDLMWGPKILLTDDLGKIPLYKSITKFLKLVII